MISTRKIILPLGLVGAVSTLTDQDALARSNKDIKEIKKPNIVMLFVDDLGWADLGYQNPKFDTPNINKLKEDGIYFSRAYNSTATSSPSRAALLTGKEALRCGFVRHIYDTGEGEFETLASDPANMRSRGWLPLEEITYAERLKKFGYYNMFVGKWHLGPQDYFPTKQGFDATYGTAIAGHPKSYYARPDYFHKIKPFESTDPNEYLTDRISKGAVEFIENYNKRKPFLLNVWFYGVHSPLIGREDLYNKYLEQGYHETEANYLAMVAALDIAVGNIIKAIEEKGISDETIIMFSSDQGGAFSNAPLSGGKMYNSLGEGGCRVPLIFYYPGMPRMGTTYDKPVGNIDVFPTFVELASGKKCKDTQISGESLIPIFKGENPKERSYFLYRSYEDQHAAIIKGDWKLIKYRSGKLELFNVTNDISEKKDLSDIQPERRDAMLKELQAWIDDATPKELLSNN